MKITVNYLALLSDCQLAIDARVRSYLTSLGKVSDYRIISGVVSRPWSFILNDVDIFQFAFCESELCWFRWSSRFVMYKLVGCERAISWNLFISYYGCAGFNSDREFFEIIVLSAATEFFWKFRRIRGGVEEAFKYLILGRGAKRCTVCS